MGRFDFYLRSLYTTLEEEYGLAIATGRRAIEAAVADEREADLLQVEVGAPLLRVRSMSYRADGLPIQYYQAIHRGDRPCFEVELIRVQEQGDLRRPLSDGARTLSAASSFVHPQ